MDILVGEIIIAILKHGMSWAAAAAFVVALYRNRNAILKLLHRGKEQDTQLDSMQRDLRAIREHLGVVECAERKDLSQNMAKPLLKYSFKGKSFVRTANAFIPKELITYSKRRKKKMKEYLKKLGRTKFQALLVSLIINVVSAVLFLNGTLDIDGMVNQWMPVINMTIGTVSTWVYIVVEGGIDKAGAQKTEVANAEFKTSTEHFE